MTIQANTLSELRDALNRLAENITPDTPVPWDVQFTVGVDGEDARVVIAINHSHCVYVTPRIDA